MSEIKDGMGWSGVGGEESEGMRIGMGMSVGVG